MNVVISNYIIMNMIVTEAADNSCLLIVRFESLYSAIYSTFTAYIMLDIASSTNNFD